MMPKCACTRSRVISISAVGFLPDRTITDALQTRPGAEYYVQLATELLAVYRALLEG